MHFFKDAEVRLTLNVILSFQCRFFSYLVNIKLYCLSIALKETELNDIINEIHAKSVYILHVILILEEKNYNLSVMIC